MNRKGRGKHLTLTQTILALADTEPLFASVDTEKIRQHGEEYYEREQDKLGEYLVAKGDITRSMLEFALSKKCEAEGDLIKALWHTQKSLEDAHDHGASLVKDLQAAMMSFRDVVSKWIPSLDESPARNGDSND